MEVLGAAPTDLWTEQQLTIKLHRNSGEREIDADLVHHLLEQRRQMEYLPSPEDHLLERETNQLVDNLLNKIRPREKDVLISRFQNDETYEEVGKKMDVSRERARQIEATALCKLRNPANLEVLNKSGLIKRNKFGGVTLDD
jgi:RNA polymerase sigma factor (sigma-70 family)